MPRRIKNNIFLRALYFDDTPPEVSDVEQHNYLRDIRYLPSDYKTRGATLIYRDRVLITSSTKSIVTVMIINPTIAESEKKKFELIWSLTQPGRRPVYNSTQ